MNITNDNLQSLITTLNAIAVKKNTTYRMDAVKKKHKVVFVSKAGDKDLSPVLTNNQMATWIWAFLTGFEHGQKSRMGGRR